MIVKQPESNYNYNIMKPEYKASIEKNEAYSEAMKRYVFETSDIMSSFITEDKDEKDNEEYQSDLKLVKYFFTDTIIGKLSKLEEDNRKSCVEDPGEPLDFIADIVRSIDLTEEENETILNSLNSLTNEDIKNITPFSDNFDMCFDDGSSEIIRKKMQEYFEDDEDAKQAQTFLYLNNQ